MSTGSNSSLLPRLSLGEELGRGALCVVRRATLPDAQQCFALKHFARHYTEESKERFLRGARLLCEQLDHPNIVKGLEYGDSETLGPYLLMPLLPGQPLSRIITQGPISPSHCLSLLTQVAQALAHSHRLGICHRDLKPSNIMCTEERAQVLDFELASYSREHEEGAPRSTQHHSITRSGFTLGTPAYLAPECICLAPRVKARITPAVDIYAWGMVFVECVCGAPIYRGETVYQILGQHLRPHPVPLPNGWPQTELGTVLAKCLEKDPSRRIPDGSALLAALETLPDTAASALTVDHAEQGLEQPTLLPLEVQ
ncbi:MAG: serine/threonine-protein kinase [Myxococcota bacterium]|jgi:serine/threonine protein kinase|nr:serine/threonine-protein kinase [Myxococcota bacterium]